MLGELFSRFVKRLYICRINRRTKQVQSKEARLFSMHLQEGGNTNV